MKRILLTAVILLLAGTVIYAQQSASNLPTSDQTRQSAQQFLNTGKSNSSQFDSTLTDFKTRNASNDDASAFRRLSYEITQLEAKINSEGARINDLLNKGSQVSDVRLGRYEQLVRQHQTKLVELESFVSD